MYVAQEHSIYGSSRVGVDNRKDTLYMGAVYTPTWGGANTSRRALGLKSFELANHLGNVLVTVSDKPIYQASSGSIYFNPEITSTSDYYPFGAPINGRSFSTTEYRFGFNTQEKTDEISGPGNHNTATFWEYDGRLGRRWNLDPVTKPWESHYACISDNPVANTDPDGDDIIVPNVADREPIIKLINARALGTFGFDNDGKLYQVSTEGDATRFSKYYADKLYSAIKDNNKIEIFIGNNIKIPSLNDDGALELNAGDAVNIDLSAGGGATFSAPVDRHGLGNRNSVVYISGNKNSTIYDTKDNKLRVEPADILAHELVGHAIPMAIGTDTGNAVENENKMRKEYKEKGQTGESPLRKSNLEHTEEDVI